MTMTPRRRRVVGLPFAGARTNGDSRIMRGVATPRVYPRATSPTAGWALFCGGGGGGSNVEPRRHWWWLLSQRQRLRHRFSFPPPPTLLAPHEHTPMWRTGGGVSHWPRAGAARQSVFTSRDGCGWGPPLPGRGYVVHRMCPSSFTSADNVPRPSPFVAGRGCWVLAKIILSCDHRRAPPVW